LKSSKTSKSFFEFIIVCRGIFFSEGNRTLRRGLVHTVSEKEIRGLFLERRGLGEKKKS